jgi:hypothetical protein
MQGNMKIYQFLWTFKACYNSGKQSFLCRKPIFRGVTCSVPYHFLASVPLATLSWKLARNRGDKVSAETRVVSNR